MTKGTVPNDDRRKHHRWTRAVLLALCGAALVPAGAAPVMAAPAAASANAAAILAAEIADRVDSDLRPFYASRGYRPLWITKGALSPAAELLARHLQSAEYDRLKPRKLKLRNVERALRRLDDGDIEDFAKAELALSEAYVGYVQALRGGHHAPMLYETEALSPAVPTPSAALRAAGDAKSLEEHVQTMGWMHPFYAPLREALADPRLSPARRHQVALNLDRVRAIPANPKGRYVMVDTASARLWMYEDGRSVDSMRVVVGKPEETTQTPSMAGFIRYAIVNPYWNVPPDLIRDRIAWNVNTKGLRYLRDSRYQVLSDWGEKATVVDPSLVDWKAVEAGAPPPRVRQLPGGSNFMGTVKFMFPNPQGIYLHDTPEKGLLRKDARQFSSGCVRLEDAQRLGRWLMGKSLPRRQREPELRIELPEMVPVYITYLTAMPEGGRIAFRDDVYARDALGDRARMARSDKSRADRP